MDDRSHLRSVLAGYDPGRLRAGKVLVAGLGAAGQNVVQNLALIGVGHLLLVDHGGFDQDAQTCSPLYPTAADTARIGLGKAAVVADRAAVLAGHLAEFVAQLLHGRSAGLGYHTDGNVRRPTLRTRQLQPDPGCRGIHAAEPLIGAAGAPDDGRVADLIAAVTRQAGHAVITLAEPAVLDAWCDTCAAECQVRATESAWLARPRCTDCGGPWQSAGPGQSAGPIYQARAGQPGSRISVIDTRVEPPAELAATTLRALGLQAGASLRVTLASGRRGLLRIPGDVLDCTELAVPPPAPPLVKAGNGLARWILP